MYVGMYIYIYVYYAYMYVCTTYVCGAHAGQKSASGPLELEYRL